MPQNFTENPSDLIEVVFNDIYLDQMYDLPFINKNISIKAVGFSVYEGDWLGVLLTPWMLSIILLPGPDRHWDSRNVGDKVGLYLPSGNYTFIYGQHDAIGNYLACSVISPVQEIANQSIGVQLAKDLRQLLTAIPTKESHVRNESRRALFGLKNSQPT